MFYVSMLVYFSSISLSKDHLILSAVKCPFFLLSSQMREDSREPLKEVALCAGVWGMEFAARKATRLTALGETCIARGLWKEEFTNAFWRPLRASEKRETYLEPPFRGDKLLRKWNGPQKIRMRS